MDSLNIVIGAGAVQGFFLAAILVVGGKRSRAEKPATGTLILAALMVLFSLSIIHTVFLRGHETIQFLFGPLVLFYVRSLSGKWRVPAWRDILHLLPFALALAARFTHLEERALDILLWGGTVVQLFAYLSVTARTVSLHDSELRNTRSTNDGDLAWIKTFLSVIAGISLIDFAHLVWSIHGGEIPFFLSVRSLALCVAVYGIGFHALVRPPARIEKYERSGLGREETDRIAAEIVAFMEREKPYLDPDLSLPELARLCGIARNQLSQALNESLGKSYYDFVNGYRIAEFRRLAADPGRAKDKILTLALDAGFNSKPAFNLVFKKTCGLTPSEFRASLRS